MAKAHGFSEDGARRVVKSTRMTEGFPADIAKQLQDEQRRQTPILSTIAFAKADVEDGATGTFRLAKGTPGEEEEDEDREVLACNSSDHRILADTKCVLSWLMVEASEGSGWHVTYILDARMVIGRTDFSHAKGATGTISVYADSGTDTGVNITATNLFADLDSGKWVSAALINGIWYLIAGEC